jgi:hypothetical protein
MLNTSDGGPKWMNTDVILSTLWNTIELRHANIAHDSGPARASFD